MQLKKGCVFFFALLVGLTFMLGQSSGTFVYADDDDKSGHRWYESDKSYKSHKSCKSYKKHKCKQKETVHEVVWPLGKWSGEVVPLPAPLTTLEGKTIASIGGAFRADETFAELAELLNEMYPGMTFITRSEIGNPRDLGAALVELGVDAAIAGNGG